MGGAVVRGSSKTEVTITDVRKPPQGDALAPSASSTPSVVREATIDRSSSSAWKRLLELEASPTQAQDRLARSATIPSFGEGSAGDYARIEIREPESLRYGPEASGAAKRILQCLAIRQRWMSGERVEPDTAHYVMKSPRKKQLLALLARVDGECQLRSADQDRRIHWDPFAGRPPPRLASVTLGFDHGVFFAADAAGSPCDGEAVPQVTEFCQDYAYVLKTMHDRGCASFCSPRLFELDLKFDLYMHRNAAREAQRLREAGGRDWYHVRKVDTHIHHSACFTQRQLLSFIRKKVTEEMDTPVLEEGGRVLTLREVFGSSGVKDAENVTADRMCCMALVGGDGHHDTFGRFDRFNGKFDPFGDKRLREIFLKTENLVQGRFLAELTKEVMSEYEREKYVCAELRISIYGGSADEWLKLARWFRKYNIQCQNVRWLIQVPRLYSMFRKKGSVRNFAELMQNVFGPLFEASLDPAAHEDMFFLLQQVVGFDSVDDESQSSNMTLKQYPSPEEWSDETNPPYTFWMFYMYANIRSLNSLRRSRGLCTFAYRPHCGEAGNVSHLCSGFMLAESICHGVQLKENPLLQYLYYLAQVGLAVSPLSNDILFIPLAESPFGTFFRRGLNVSLSTDDPLIIHLTGEALIEEYVIACRVFRLSVGDLCEIARNSVLQCGFEQAFREWWIGDAAAGPQGNEEAKTNVPTMRLQFRADCLRQELEGLAAAAREYD